MKGDVLFYKTEDGRLIAPHECMLFDLRLEEGDMPESKKVTSWNGSMSTVE